MVFFFFSSRRRHTRSLCDWSSDVCSSDLARGGAQGADRRLSGRGFQDRALRRLLPRRGLERNVVQDRSEERRVGKECRSRWWPAHLKKKKKAVCGEAKNGVSVRGQ